MSAEKAKKVKARPDGFNTVSAHLVVPNAVAAAELYEKAFGAKLIARLAGPDGESTMHAELKIGDSIIMLSDENPQRGARCPATIGGSPVALHLYVDDADATYEQAIAAGCTPSMPLMDAFWGDRYGRVADPFGFEWGIATHVEDLTPTQIGQRSKAFFAAMAAQGT